MNDFSGFHVGIVVENDDPELGGRVKVWVPEHSPNLDKFTEWIKSGKEIKISAIDKDMSPEFVEILDDLKKSLPWAEYAGPIFGGSSIGRFNCPRKVTSTNDNSSFGEKGAQNGFRPANQFMEHDVPIDDFVVEDSRTINMTNPNGMSYEPANYSGMARGVFSVPNVGAQVYLFYLNNDPMYPVYFAASYSMADIRKIYTQKKESDDLAGPSMAYDYPNEFENGNDRFSADGKIFRSKTVLNSNKNTIEMIDTDGAEAVRVQHYGGAFKQYTNYGATEFVPGSDQKLVRGRSFLTVKGNSGVSVGGDESHRVRGNRHSMVGDFNEQSEAVEKIKTAMNEIADIKRLFPVRRARAEDRPQSTSTLQKREPATGKGFITCPTCGGLAYDPYNVNGLNVGGTYIDDTTKEGKAKLAEYYNVMYSAMSETGDKVDASIIGFETTKSKISDDVEYGWSRIPRAVTYCSNQFVTLAPYFSKEYLEGTDSAASASVSINDVSVPSASGEEATAVKREKHGGTGKVGIFGGIRCPTCNNILWQQSEQTSGWSSGMSGMSGYSPSTEGGSWAQEDALLPGGIGVKIASSFHDVCGEFTKLGAGGDDYDTVSMSRVTTIGTVFNDAPSFRVDPIGKLRLDGLFVTQQSTIPYYLPTPHVEPVDVTSIPGGDWNLTICNKWNVSVGSQGISIKTTGGLQIGGGITSIATQELNISSKNDMVIDGGERLMLRARKMTINPVEHNALSIDGQLHVLRNMVVRGGTLLEGEVAVQHVTAPGELVATSPEVWTGSESERCYVGASLAFAEGAFDVQSEESKEEEQPKKKKKKHGWGKFKDNLEHTWNNTKHAMANITPAAIVHYVPDVRSTFNKGLDYVKQTVKGIFGKKNGLSADDVNKLISAELTRIFGAGIEVTLGLPTHEHTYLQIPTTFKDCPNAVRASLLGKNNNINSRQIVVSAKRRHHMGALMQSDIPMKVYEKNKAAFDKLIWEAICRDGYGIEASMLAKGMVQGRNPNTALNPRTYALSVYSGLEGSKGVLLFYTIRAYYKEAMKNTKDMDIGKKLSANIVCRVMFDIASVGDEESDLGEQSGKITDDSTELSNDFVEGSVRAGLVNVGTYGNLVNKNPKTMIMKGAWLLAYDILGL